MGVTRFPNGISIGAEGSEVYPVTSTGAEGVKVAGNAGTVITGAGTVSTGLTTITGYAVSLAGTLELGGTASGAPWVVKAASAAGNLAIRVYDATGAAASNAGTVSFTAVGT